MHHTNIDPKLPRKKIKIKDLLIKKTNELEGNKGMFVSSLMSVMRLTTYFVVIHDFLLIINQE